MATARKKAPYSAPVIQFYQSPLFIKSVEYGKRYYDRLYFYNAKDGLLLPDQWMAPYDVSIKTFSIGEKKAWASKVVNRLLEYEDPAQITLYLHGGMVYRKHLEPELNSYGFQFTVPLQGYSIGEQLKWYKEKLAK
ncbi:hypothetical protein GCM10011391_29820 [Pullulanibacillus camelliae]|uniref:DUF6884 domain-containing protein n=1 Tax=Pullulanibacillus camelliae TaxID=1707096 RepID=A0A8J2YJR5_9BACL|nr:DUF6884 domain-containing protein [Pullulanibacillus camelliae]GGE49038.1 hypothetical protein GCM10011391_29820 [Pullulanibacillus camelliae]